MGIKKGGPVKNEIIPVRAVQAPDTGDVLSMGKLLADSGLFPDTQAAAQAAFKVMAGREVGFGPVASMTGINVIKGRVSLSANLIAAAIKRSRRYDYRVRKHNDQACEIEFFDGEESVGTSAFSMEEARRAGLAAGDAWRRYPKNMLFARAISNGAKWFCPDVFGGPVYTPDELDPTARVDPETGEVFCSPSRHANDLRRAEGSPQATEVLPTDRMDNDTVLVNQ
jgi:hypothetical protein